MREPHHTAGNPSARTASPTPWLPVPRVHAIWSVQKPNKGQAGRVVRPAAHARTLLHHLLHVYPWTSTASSMHCWPFMRSHNVGRARAKSASPHSPVCSTYTALIALPADNHQARHEAHARCCFHVHATCSVPKPDQMSAPAARQPCSTTRDAACLEHLREACSCLRAVLSHQGTPSPANQLDNSRLRQLPLGDHAPVRPSVAAV